MRLPAMGSVLVLLASVLIFAKATAQATASFVASRDQVSPMSPDPSSTYNQLFGVSASSATDVWAVGGYRNDITHVYETLILHWDGVSWTQIACPNPSSTANGLDAVRAVSSTNAWAVGDYVSDTTGAYETLILHWNGTAWSKVASPNPSATENYLDGVTISSTSARSGWAVGDFYNGKTKDYDTLAVRWNGSTWSHVASPSPSSSENYLNSVRAPSPTNAWAVGYSYTGTRDVTLIEHWNGTAWSKVGSPNTGSSDNLLYATSGVSPSNGWAVGNYLSGSVNDTLALHWNGTVWSRVATPSPSSTENFLFAMRARSATDAWAVGEDVDNVTSDYVTLVVHWNGTKWTRTPTPSPGTLEDELTGVTATSSMNAWAVGWYETSADDPMTMILHWDGTAWSAV